MSLRAPAVVLVLFLSAYALWHAAPPGSAPLCRVGSLALLALTLLALFLRRVREILAAVDPFCDLNTSAVFIAGCDRSAGWFTAIRFSDLGVRVFAGFEDPSSEQAVWFKRFLGDNVELVRLRPNNATDAKNAAAFVQRSLGERVLVAAVYAIGSVPKVTNPTDISEFQKGIDLNALGAVTVAQHFGPLLQNSGRYVIVSDLAGRLPFPSIMPYCMSQLVAQQFINAVKRDMEKLSVSVHVIEPLLHTWQSVQSKEFYPAASEEDARVIFSNEAQQLDDNLYDLSQSINQACFSKHPKERYLPSTDDFLVGTIISFAPRCLMNWLACHLEEVKNIHNPLLDDPDPLFVD